MIHRSIQILLICITIISCEKPRAYKPQEAETLRPKKIPVVIVNDSDEEEIVDQVDFPSAPEVSEDPIESTIPETSSTPSTPTSPECCKICKSSIPCGNACISSTKTCSKGSGCACNADGTRP